MSEIEPPRITIKIGHRCSKKRFTIAQFTIKMRSCQFEMKVYELSIVIRYAVKINSLLETVANAERIFSKLKLIKTYLCSTRVIHFQANLSIENYKAQRAAFLDFLSTLFIQHLFVHRPDECHAVCSYA